MTLPHDFQFSQGSLQDYLVCPLRFYLRHVRRLAWPAIVAEPALEHERHLLQGSDFHHLIHQHEVGISAEQLIAVIADENLRRWWLNYLERGPGDIPEEHYSEIVLSTPVGGHRLVAKYDLLAVDPGKRAIILDWKTYRRRPGRKWLEERVQTRVYSYVLVRAVSDLNDGRPIEPARAEMVYWFADFPDDQERFRYDEHRYGEDEIYLSSLIEEIEGLPEDQFDRTADQERCRLCRYRSLCQRGVRAGDFREAEEERQAEEELEIFLDFDQIAEIEY
jgi:CRISPR/Cas system-associated exonuclease Cas4 (RecB family)